LTLSLKRDDDVGGTAPCSQSEFFDFKVAASLLFPLPANEGAALTWSPFEGALTNEDGR